MAEYIEQGRRAFSDADRGGTENPYAVPGLGRYALLPGDPDRVARMAAQWDDGARQYDLNRGFRAAVGTYHGAKLAAMSTGIGGASLENPFMGLAMQGVDTFIRVGTTGTLQADIAVGDLIINDACVRLDGLSPLYVRPEYPAAADSVVTLALIQAAETLGVPYHVGTGCTACSYYAGQSRPGFNGYLRADAQASFDDLKNARVLNYEMEAAALLTLSRLYGFRAGMCAAVVANRITGEFDGSRGQEEACLVGAEAVRILTEWDALAKAAGRTRFTPDLLLKK